MLVTDLINEFAERTTLPVDVNDVVACLAAKGLDDQIEFIGVDLDPDILQGQIKIFHVRNGVYADPVRHANIYYHRGHTIDWQRLICCKELIHILDPQSAKTSTTEEIRKLAEKIGLPPEMQDPESDGLATNIDRLAEFRAAAILLPWAAREVLMPAYKSDVITIEDIARLADIPRKYVGFIMNPIWDKVYPLLSK